MSSQNNEYNFFTSFMKKAQASPAKIIALSFFAVILIGTLLLLLPSSSASGVSPGLLIAAFTATSATCVTGLVLVDTASYWSLQGQIVILALIQTGGLGLVTITTFFFTVLRKKMGIRTMTLARETTASFSLSEVKKLVRKVIAVTFSFEFIGFLIFSWRFIPHMGFKQGAYNGLFHSVSSFCNAGFDLMGNFSGEFSSLTAWNNDPVLIFSTAILIICGGLGFIVWSDIFNLNKEKGLNFHTKLVLVSTVVLIATGTLFFILAERNNMSAQSMGSMSFFQKFQASFFQSVTARTAGFNTISQFNLTEISKILNNILMFIGAASGSTAGGIKITTFTVLIFYIIAEVKGNPDILIMKRRIPKEIASRAIIIFALSAFLVVTATMLLSVFERSAVRQGMFSTLDILFETVSAFGTVGLSAIGTFALQTRSQIVLLILMFIGRIGPVSFGIALAGRVLSDGEKIYPEGKVIVG